MSQLPPGSMPAPSPEVLFARYQQDGDADSLAALFDRTAPEVYRVARYLSRDQDEAEDLLQATFLVVIEQAAGFRPGARVMPWLLGILANKARQRGERRHLERRLRERGADRPSAGIGGGAADSTDPVEAAQTAELRACLDRELERLSATLRPVLVMHLRHGLDPADIARALDRPAGTVRSQICRGMEVLRRSLPKGLATLAFAGAAAVPPHLLAQARHVVLARAREAALPAAVASVSPAAAVLLIMHTKVLLSSLTAVLIVTAVLFWRPWEASGETFSSGQAGPPGPRSVATAAGGGDHERAIGGMATVKEELPVSDSVPAGASPHDPLVRIVDAATGAGVAGAEVLHHWPRGSKRPPGHGASIRHRPTNDLVLAGEDFDHEAWMRRAGAVSVTDARGFVRLAYDLVRGSRDGSVVAAGSHSARKGELYGRFDIELPAGSDVAQVVAIGRERSVDIQVIDGEGRPLPDVPLGLRKARGSGVSSYIGTTKAPDGIFRLRHLQTYDVPRDEQGRRRLYVAPYCLGPGTEGIAIDCDAPPAVPVRLVYPANGRLVVQLRDALGEPWARGLSLLGQPSSSSTTPKIKVLCWWPGGSMSWHVPPDAEGRCVLPFVALGQRFEVSWFFDDPVHVRHMVRGPERPGETVHFELAAERPLAVLRGRLLDPAGAPAAGREFAVTCTEYRIDRLETDAQGRFRVALRGRAEEQPPAGAAAGHGDGVTAGVTAEPVECYITEKPRKGATEHRGVRVTLPPRGTAPELSVGDLVLQPTPVLVAGRIFGGPLWDAPSMHVTPKGEASTGTGVRLPWPVTLLWDDGRYEVRGFVAPSPSLAESEHVLRVHCDRYHAPELTFLPGRRDLDVHLVASAEVMVALRHGAAVAARSLKLVLAPDETTSARMVSLGRTGRPYQGWLEADGPGVGRTRWPDVVAGTYTLGCYCIGWPQPILELRGVVVEGGRCRDPRLSSIDVTAAARATRRLTLLDPAGGRPSWGSGHVWYAGTARPGDVTTRDGVLQLAVPAAAGPVDLLVHVHGCRAQVVAGVLADREVRLEPGIGVRFVLRGASGASGALPQPPPKTKLVLTMTVDPATPPFAARGGSWSARGVIPPESAEATATGEFACVLATPGRYALRLELVWRESHRRVSLPLPLPAACATVVVEDRPGQVFELELDEGALAAVFAEGAAAGK